jgi:hypothetical protein
MKSSVELNAIIWTTFRELRAGMDGAKEPEKVLLRFVRQVARSHDWWGPYALGRGAGVIMHGEEERTCRICGCTEEDGCATENGTGCFWAGEDLCSECVEMAAGWSDGKEAGSLKRKLSGSENVESKATGDRKAGRTRKAG